MLVRTIIKTLAFMSRKSIKSKGKRAPLFIFSSVYFIEKRKVKEHFFLLWVPQFSKEKRKSFLYMRPRIQIKHLEFIKPPGFDGQRVHNNQMKQAAKHTYHIPHLT